MATFVCEKCGAPLEAVLGKTILKCTYCGYSQAITIPELERDDEITKYYKEALAFFEKGEWKNAKDKADKLTSIAADNKVPCLLHMMYEHRVTKEDKLGSLPVDLADSPFYAMIMEEGSDELKLKAENYRVSSFSAYCKKVTGSSYKYEELQKIEKILKEYPDIDNSKALLKECQGKLAMLNQVSAELEYIKERIILIPSEINKEGKKSKLKSKLSEISDKVSDKFNDYPFAPVIVHLDDGDGIFTMEEKGSTYTVKIGDAYEMMTLGSQMKLILMLVDKSTKKIAVSRYISSHIDAHDVPEYTKTPSIKFPKNKLAVCNIEPRILSSSIDMDYL
ncbi:MAG: hypothetical protein K5656_03670 [Lachnospiraceae bacterium]|nr:hypothetical protein [Lachnospiraceae bacterium]